MLSFAQVKRMDQPVEGFAPGEWQAEHRNGLSPCLSADDAVITDGSHEKTRSYHAKIVITRHILIELYGACAV